MMVDGNSCLSLLGVLLDLSSGLRPTRSLDGDSGGALGRTERREEEEDDACGEGSS